MSHEQLINIINEAISSELKKLNLGNPKQLLEEYLTIKEVSLIFKINISSVHNWRKEGHLKAHQIGGRVYFKKSEIDNSLVELKY